MVLDLAKGNKIGDGFDFILFRWGCNGIIYQRVVLGKKGYLEEDMRDVV